MVSFSAVSLYSTIKHSSIIDHRFHIFLISMGQWTKRQVHRSLQVNNHKQHLSSCKKQSNYNGTQIHFVALFSDRGIAYRLIRVRHVDVTFSFSQSRELVGSHDDPMLLITSSITNPKVSLLSSSASSMEAAIFSDRTNYTINPHNSEKMTLITVSEIKRNNFSTYFMYAY